MYIRFWVLISSLESTLASFGHVCLIFYSLWVITHTIPCEIIFFLYISVNKASQYIQRTIAHYISTKVLDPNEWLYVYYVLVQLILITNRQFKVTFWLLNSNVVIPTQIHTSTRKNPILGSGYVTGPIGSRHTILTSPKQFGSLLADDKIGKQEYCK